MPVKTLIRNSERIPELQTIRMAIKGFDKSDRRDHAQIFKALDDLYSDFSDSDKIVALMGNPDYLIWLQRFVMSNHARARIFFSTVSKAQAITIIDAIRVMLDTDLRPTSNINDIQSKLSICCYILALCVKKLNYIPFNFLVALQNYVSRMEAANIKDQAQVIALIKQQLHQVVYSDYMSIIYVMVVVSGMNRHKDISAILEEDGLLDYSNQTQMEKLFNDAPLFWIDFFSSKPRRATKLLKEANRVAIKDLVDITMKHINEKNDDGLVSFSEVSSRLNQAAMLYQLVCSEKYTASTLEIEKIIFALLKTPIQQFSDVSYAVVEEHFKELEMVIMDFISYRKDVAFVDADNKTLLHYVKAGNSDEFVTFLFDNGANIGAKDNKGVSAILSILSISNASSRFLDILKNKIISEKDFGQLILEAALQDCYNNYHALKEQGYNPFRTIPLLLRLLFETFKTYTNLELKFSQICLWNVQEFKLANKPPFTNENLIRNMFKAIERPLSLILMAVQKAVNPDIFNNCLVALLNGAWPDTVDSNFENLYNLQIWQYLSENPELCTFELANSYLESKSTSDPLRYEKFLHAATLAGDANPFHKAVGVQNVKFLAFALKVFHSSGNLTMALSIASAATNMIRGEKDIQQMQPLLDLLQSLKPRSYFHSAAPFVMLIDTAIKKHIVNVTQKEQSNLFCLPVRACSAKQAAFM